MATIIRKRATVERVWLARQYAWTNDSNGGFSFPCLPDGTIQFSRLSGLGRDNAIACPKLVERGLLIDKGVVESRWNYQEPAILRCDCGGEVFLDDVMTNTCVCGRDYNGSGQLLAPRSQWGEETGETLADILRGGCYDGED